MVDCRLLFFLFCRCFLFLFLLVTMTQFLKYSKRPGWLAGWAGKSRKRGRQTSNRDRGAPVPGGAEAGAGGLPLQQRHVGTFEAAIHVFTITHFRNNLEPT